MGIQASAQSSHTSLQPTYKRYNYYLQSACFLGTDLNQVKNIQNLVQRDPGAIFGICQNFCKYLLSSSDLAPVHTIFPELKIRAVVRGSLTEKLHVCFDFNCQELIYDKKMIQLLKKATHLILIITAANRFGLYSAFLACKAIFFRSSFTPMLTVLQTR